MDNSEVNNNLSGATLPTQPDQPTQQFSSPLPEENPQTNQSLPASAINDISSSSKDPSQKKSNKKLILVTIAIVIACCIGIVLVLSNWLNQQDNNNQEKPTEGNSIEDEFMADTYEKFYALILTDYESEDSLVNNMDKIIDEISDENRKNTAQFLKIRVLTENGYYEKSEELLNNIKESNPQLAETCDFASKASLLYFMWKKDDLQKYYSQKVEEKCEETN